MIFKHKKYYNNNIMEKALRSQAEQEVKMDEDMNASEKIEELAKVKELQSTS